MMSLQQPSAYVQQGSHIMVIDSSPANLITSVLGLQGYDVIWVTNGALALARIVENPPQLVISTINHLDQTQKTLRAHILELKRLPYIPILFIAKGISTVSSDDVDFDADDFIRQPIEVDELLVRVRSLLKFKRSIDEREKIIQVREEFLSRLTHDLRTPLVAADRMFARLIEGKHGPLSQDISQILLLMQSNNNDLLGMTNTLLDIYRYEAGSKTLSFTSFNLQELLDSIIKELSPLVENKEIQLSLNIYSPKLPQFWRNPWIIRGVKLELRRAFTNLIGNAIKFTDKGRISVTLRSELGGYKIQIEDTGCGIAVEDIPLVFNRFYQGINCRSGYGLGLNLVKQITQSHGGEIKVESTLGVGTKFTLFFPLVSI